MTLTREQCLEAMDSLQFPPVFRAIWQQQGPRRFCLHWKFPKRFFDPRWALEPCLPLDSIVPLLESQDELVAFDLTRRRYIYFVYTDNHFTDIAATYQQFVTYVFLDLAYADLMDVVDEVADLFEYKHLGALREFVDRESDGDYRVERRNFISAIPD